ncbi:NADH kinase pos5, mitochondrial [Golovinomyces cichoracearum]|uniref:NADH kinase pos5, mitochondrial n=1 Tax=Golovinomyces cichoracearum TaxID=62708 RepID=A0A420H902_9PEZI|nr:NADH kinase pos5, mitochondrial [Golovinomyces cichoracearum]
MRSAIQKIVLRNISQKTFSSTSIKREIRDISDLKNAVVPQYVEEIGSELLCLKWPRPPRNVLLVMKDGAPQVTESLIEFAKHIHSNYEVALIFEIQVAKQIHDKFNFPIYATDSSSKIPLKVDLTTTLGGDGTILHAASIFNTSTHVPPILSFSLGTLGFLGEWKFSEYKRAFREVYVSGASPGLPHLQNQTKQFKDENSFTGWSGIRGKPLGWSRRSKILLRNRIKVGVFDVNGNRVALNTSVTSCDKDISAMNEVIVHRGQEAQLAIIDILVAGRFLTEAVADGIIIATPTGSTAYSLSSGGSIVHPLVSSILLTPICPRSLSFRPLVLPTDTPITLRLSEKNRGRELEVSIDGHRLTRQIGLGMEIRVCANDIVRGENWTGGLPCIMRSVSSETARKDDGWVGGLNGLLKFNYPFGAEST